MLVSLEKETVKFCSQKLGLVHRTGKPCILVNKTRDGFSSSSWLQPPNWSSSPQPLSHSYPSSVPLLECSSSNTNCFMYPAPKSTVVNFCRQIKCLWNISTKKASTPAQHRGVLSYTSTRGGAKAAPCVSLFPPLHLNFSLGDSHPE